MTELDWLGDNNMKIKVLEHTGKIYLKSETLADVMKIGKLAERLGENRCYASSTDDYIELECDIELFCSVALR